MVSRLCLALLLAGSTLVVADAPAPATEGEARLCQLYNERSQQRWGRFNVALRPLGEEAARWQIELWQDLAFIQQDCPVTAKNWSREQRCLLGRYLLGTQRSYLASQSWRRSQTGEEASLVLELGDQVDRACGAPVMAVQSVLQRLYGLPQPYVSLQMPVALAFNPQGWTSSLGVKGSSASTKK